MYVNPTRHEVIGLYCFVHCRSLRIVQITLLGLIRLLPWAIKMQVSYANDAKKEYIISTFGFAFLLVAPTSNKHKH